MNNVYGNMFESFDLNFVDVFLSRCYPLGNSLFLNIAYTLVHFSSALLSLEAQCSLNTFNYLYILSYLILSFYVIGLCN